LSWRSGARCPAVFVGIAAVGAAITVVGSYLILSDATGLFLAGLVSSVGFALIGVWLFASIVGSPPTPPSHGACAGPAWSRGP
jgi:hypothetical protein